MKKQILISLIFFSTFFSINAQQIGNGLAPIITNFGDILQSGVYNGLNASGSTPDNSFGGWQHLFVIRHPNSNNNHQFQLGTSFTENDRLFFRKIATNLTPRSPDWIELATRGSNTFLGNQSIIGNLGIGTIDPSEKLEIFDSNTTPGIISLKSSRNDAGYVDVGRISAKQGSIEVARIGLPRAGQTNSGYLTFWTKIDNASDLKERVRIDANGNVGIGTNTPSYKLDVCGTLRAKEVIVDLNGTCAPDFVFKSDYKLMNLIELEKFVKTNQHLPEITSEKEMVENGVNMKDLQMKLLQKIEELTLYTIEQNKKIIELEKQNEKIKVLEEKIEKIESASK